MWFSCYFRHKTQESIAFKVVCGMEELFRTMMEMEARKLREAAGAEWTISFDRLDETERFFSRFPGGGRDIPSPPDYPIY